MFLSLVFAIGTAMSCAAQEWPRLWSSYATAFMDDQVRVIDRSDRDRTTSEGQAYALFFALVANDRERFDRLLAWTERNLASGDLSAHLPAWLWGRSQNNQWGVLDGNPASDADVWMAYTLLEAGAAWKEPRYTALGASVAQRIVEEEVVRMPSLGPVLLPGPTGFQKDESVRLNASYLPLQIFIGLGQLHPEGPWGEIAARIPDLVRASAPRGFATDWVDLLVAGGFKPSATGSYDAIRVYLWAGMLDPSTPGRDAVLAALTGMAQQLRAHGAPPAKISAEGVVSDPKGPVGFQAALLPYLAALGETKLAREQAARVRSELDEKTGLYGRPPTYYDQNLMLFALGFNERHFWFDARGRLRTRWSDER